MGSLFLEVGQCGNQVGIQLMDYLDQSTNQYEESYMKRTGQNIFHSIMLDTEPKILRSVMENKKRYPFIDNKNIIFCEHGRGNNWALGYMDLNMQQKKKKRKTQEKVLKFDKFTEKPLQLLDLPNSLSHNSYQTGNEQVSIPAATYLKENSQIIDNCIQVIRKEIEKTDYFIGMHMISSLGGGTGSGLGSRLVEEFKDVFNDIQLVNTVVFPSRSGETTLQHYNCILSLAQLQSFSDCIIYFQNDKINNYLSYSKSKNIEKSVDITNINQYIGSQLHNLVRINDYSSFNRFYFDMLMDTAPLNDFKFVELYSTPYFYDKTISTSSQATWEQVVDSVCGQINVEDSYLTEGVKFQENDEEGFQDLKNYKNQAQKQKNVSLSVNSVFRSYDVNKSLAGQTSLLKNVTQKMNNALNPVRFNPDCINHEFIEEKLKEGIDNKMMLTMANRSSIADIIKEISDIGYSKYKANAFLHWYYKYDLEKQDFEEAFISMDNIMDNYNSLK